MDFWTIVGIAVFGLFVGLGVVAFWVMTLLRRVVPTNEVHVVRSRDKTVAYGTGKAVKSDGDSGILVDPGTVYYAWPAWLPKYGIEAKSFPKSIFAVSLEKYEAYDKGRLPFLVNVQAFFRIEDFERAAARIEDASTLMRQLSGVLEGVVRRILATNELENIMQDRSTLGEQFTKEVNDQLAEWGVHTSKSIEFMDIKDQQGSEVIHNIMEKEKSRIEMESRSKVAENNKIALTAEIEAQREVDLRKQDAQQVVGERTAQQEKMVGIANEVAQQEIKEAAKITAEKEMAVIQVKEVRAADIKKEVAVVNANASKEVAVVKANADKEVAVVKANADKEVIVTNANGEKESMVLIADGTLVTQQKNAEGIQAVGIANGVAEKAKQMAVIEPQIALADKIGKDEGYQNYLQGIRQTEAIERIGIENAKALANAEIKVIANGGTVTEGLGSIGEIFSAKGGTKIGALFTALKNNPDVVEAVAKVMEKGE